MSKKVKSLGIAKVYSIAILVTAVLMLLGSTMAFAYTQTIMSEKFEGSSWTSGTTYTNNQTVGNWKMTRSAIKSNGSIAAGNVELQTNGTSNKSLVLSTNPAASILSDLYFVRSTAQYNLSNVNRRYLEVNFDMQSSKTVAVPSGGDTNGQVLFSVVQTVNGSTSNKYVFGYSNDTFFDAKTWGTPVPLSSSVGTTKHTVKIIFDTSSAKTASFYVDGALKGTATYTAAELQGITGINFMATKNYLDTVDSLKMYIDNVSILSYDVAYYSGNFDNFATSTGTGYANNAVENGWTFSGITTTALEKIIDQGSGDKCLNFDTTASTVNEFPAAKYTLTSPTTKRFVDFDYSTKFNSTYKPGVLINYTFNDNSTRDLFEVSQNQYIIYSPWSTSAKTLSADIYHTVKVRYDTTLKKFHLFIDNNYITTVDISLEAGSSTKTSVKRIQLNAREKLANVSIDNVAISESDYVSSQITNSNNDKLTKVTSGTLGSIVEIVNPSVSATMPVWIAMAKYKYGLLTGISTTGVITVAAGAKTTYNTLTIPCDGSDDYVKTFVFDDILTIKPYIAPSILTK